MLKLGCQADRNEMKPQFITSSLIVVIFVGLNHVDCGIEVPCLNGIADCCGLTSEPFVMTGVHLEQWYRPLAVEVLEEAYGVIDEHLKKDIGTANLEANIGWIRSQLSRELIAADPDRKLCDRLFRNRPSLAGRLQSKDPGVIINALFRLIKLEETDSAGLKCSYSVTRHIAMNNEIANDPLGRRVRGEPAIFMRIDNLIVNSAIERAHFCIPLYRDQLGAISRITNQYVVAVRNLWTMILGHRFRNDKFEERAADLDRVFTWYSKGAVNRVKQMEHALEEEEVGPLIDFLDKTEQCNLERVAQQYLPDERPGTNGRLSKFRGCLANGCILFNRLVSVWFESLDFDMQLRDYILEDIVETIELDSEVNKQRAFHHMCCKLLEEKDRIIELISRRDESHDSTSTELNK